MEYEKILFSRLILSFFWTVILHFFPLSFYIFITNFDLVHPLNWVVNSTLLVFSIETWISLIPLQGLIFTLGYVLSQELKKPRCLITSRFKHLLSFFRKTNILKCFLYFLLGIILPWTYLKLNNAFLTKQCLDFPQSLCVDENVVFIMTCCIWTAVYHFIRSDLLTEKYLQFPIIRQLRFLQIRSKFPQIFKNSFKLSVVPVFYFLPFYLWYGKQVVSIFEFFLPAVVEKRVSSLLNISLIVKSWLISTIYFTLLGTLQSMIEIHFTERHSFALVKQPNSKEILLPAALGEQNIPIIQYLACYDLYILSLSQKSVRWQVFTLSQPGGHPHTWNAILHESLKLIDKFICEVDEIYKAPEPAKPNPLNPVPRNYHVRNMSSPHVEVPSPTNRRMRNLLDHPDMFPIQQQQQHQQHSALDDIWMKLDIYMDCIQHNIVFNYIFGSKPDCQIRFLVSNSQPLIWVVQSISELAANALMEDQFGIVLKDLPLIINTLLRLKFSVDKLGNIQKKFQKQDHDLCMKASLKSALKRSLYRIAIAYSDYLTDLSLPPENLNCMKSFVNFKEC